MGITRYVNGFYRYFVFPISLIWAILYWGFFIVYSYGLIPMFILFFIDLLNPSSWEKYSLRVYPFELVWITLLLLSNRSFFRFMKRDCSTLIRRVLLTLYIIHGLMQAFMLGYETIRLTWNTLDSFPFTCDICHDYVRALYYATWISTLLLMIVNKVVFRVIDRKRRGVGQRR